jgi:hypothetical protein
MRDATAAHEILVPTQEQVSLNQSMQNAGVCVALVGRRNGSNSGHLEAAAAGQELSSRRLVASHGPLGMWPGCGIGPA